MGLSGQTRAALVFSALFLSFYLSHPAFAESPKENTCIGCHSDTADEIKGSVHFQQGILCQNCHGGDPTKDDMEAAHAPAAGFIGVPDKKAIAEKCGSCHADVEVMNFYGVRTDQLARYKTSKHGKKLLLEGDTHVAVCSDCHGYHNVLPVSDPNSPVYPLNVPKTCNHCHGNEKLMSAYHLPSDIFKTYESSVHGRALFEKKDISVANCVSCHGSHGAVPPGVKDVATTCGKCHANEKKYFLESVHAKAQEQGKFSECISCHGNHGVEPVTKALFEKACTKCHEPGSEGAKLARTLEDLMGDAEAKFTLAESQVKQASIEGLYVEEETAALEEIKTNVIAMKPLQHTLSSSKLDELHKKVVSATEQIQANIHEKRRSIRRHKLALIPIWILIFVVISALWAKYKQLTQGKK